MSGPRKRGSRPAVGRPRRLAGRPPRPTEQPEVEQPEVEEGAPAPVSKPPEPDQPEPVQPEPDRPVVEEGAPAPVSKPPRARRTTWILAAVLVVLAAVGVAEVVYLGADPEPTVSAQRPVVAGELTHRSAVGAAARATEQILSSSYQDYDAQVDEATELMTDAFAEEYRATSEGIKDQFVAQRTKLQVKAVAQGVVQASSQQVQALLFLNQYVEKVQRGEPATAYAQYRALVTVVRTDRGWVVSDIETQ